MRVVVVAAVVAVITGGMMGDGALVAWDVRIVR